MRERGVDRQRSVLAAGGICALLFLVAALAAGCRDVPSRAESEDRAPSAAAQEAEEATGSPYLSGYVDFRKWATKKASVAEAEESLGIKVRAPSETLGRKLKQVYAVDSNGDGVPRDRFEQAAVLDYGDFTVGFDITGSKLAAESSVASDLDSDAVAAGLARRATVRGKSASLWAKGESEMVVDAKGKTVRPGVFYRASHLGWAEGSIYVSITSSSLSPEELLAIAESIDYE